jgi:hypothetical protein
VFVNSLNIIKQVEAAMQRRSRLTFLASYVIIGLPFIFMHPAFAATAGDITSVQDFIRSVIKILAGLAGLVATGFFVAGGFSYIASTGHPQKLDKAKHTILYSAVGLSVVIAAFVISNIVTTLATNAFGS